jgi:hypothetical protein
MNTEVKFIIENIVKKERFILLNNGRSFVSSGQFDSILKLWSNGDLIDVVKHNSDNPYSYELSNLNTENSIFCQNGN